MPIAFGSSAKAKYTRTAGHGRGGAAVRVFLCLIPACQNGGRSPRSPTFWGSPPWRPWDEPNSPSPAGQLRQQPRLRVCPPPLGGGQRDAEHLGRLGHG